jgi:hypothetical protein
MLHFINILNARPAQEAAAAKAAAAQNVAAVAELATAAPDLTQQVKNTLLVSRSLPTRAQEPLHPAIHVLLLDVRDEDAFRSCRSTAALS